MPEKKEVELPASVVKTVLDRKQGENGKTKRIPLSWDEVMEQKREAMAMKMQEKLMMDEFDEGGNPKSNGGDTDFDKTMNQMMKYSMIMNMDFGGKKQRQDDDSPVIREMREQNRILREQLEEQKRKQEIQDAIKPLQDQLSQLINKPRNSEDENKEIKSLQTQIADLNNKLFRTQEDAKHDEVMSSLASIQEKYNDLKADYDALKANPKKDDVESFVEQIEALDKKKKALGKALGLTEKETDEMGVGEMIEQGVDLFPKIGEGISTIRDAFTNKEIENDVPPQMQPNYSLPQRNTPTNTGASVDPRIERFLAQCTERGGQMYDPEGIAWTTIDGKALSKQSIRDIAIFDPDSILERMSKVRPQRPPAPKREAPQTPAPENIPEQAKNEYQESQDQSAQAATETPQDTTITSTAPEPTPAPEEPATAHESDVPNDEPLNETEQGNDNKDAEQETQTIVEEPKPEPEQQGMKLDSINPDSMNDEEALNTANMYINSMQTWEQDGEKYLTGADGEFYNETPEDGSPMITDPEKLRSEAVKDPKEFLKIAKESQRRSREILGEGQEGQ